MTAWPLPRNDKRGLPPLDNGSEESGWRVVLTGLETPDARAKRRAGWVLVVLGPIIGFCVVLAVAAVAV